MTNLREAILACLGDFPPAVPTDWRREGVETRGDIVYTRVSYDLAADERVWGWLLEPVRDPSPDKGGATTPPSLPGKGGGGLGPQRPAILALHQHAGEYYLGKAEPAGLGGNPAYHYGLELARRGYTVFCPDHLAFEDRRPPEYERVARPGALQDRGYEDWLGKAYLVRGSTLQAKYLSDLARALDVLAEQPGVDPAALGCIGHSLGGQEALWLAWYDERIRAAVSSCGVSLVSTIVRDRINHNMALWLPGLLKVADMDAVVAGIAPRAVMLIQGDQDPIFPLDGVHHIGRVAHLAYTDCGQPDRFALTTFPGGHGFPVEMRKAAYQWLDTWLKRPTRARRTPEPLW